MTYINKAWRPIQSEEITLTPDRRPVCPGNSQAGKGPCAERPDHVVVFYTNSSHLPGQGVQQVQYACFRHLHSVLKFAEGVATFATVSTYKGV